MARVVQQRTTPPYLLIVMVFLFLIAATVAVLMYLQSDKMTKQVEKTNETLRILASSDDLRDENVRQLMTWYGDPPPGEQRGRTVVTQLQEQVEMLTQLMAGTPVDPQIAASQADSAFDRIGSRRGLIIEVNDLFDQLDRRSQQVAEKDRLLAQKDEELRQKQDMVSSVSADLEARMARLDQRVRDLDQQLAEAHRQYRSDLAGARSEWEQQRADLDRNIAGKTQIIQELEMRNQALDGQVKRLQNRLQIATRPEDKPIKVAQRADGKILEVRPEEGLCYISLGSQDRVTPGLSFTVYPPTGIPEDGSGKATVVVTNVGRVTSECRIQTEQPGDPIATGDLIANLAFDTTQSYTFVVEGVFDLYGTDHPTEEGAEEVKALIKRFGGQIASDISIDTDFLVLGGEPQRPPQPPEAAPPQSWQVYRDSLAIFNRYNAIREQAESLNIPVLNTSRFLAFVGYVPTRAGG